MSLARKFQGALPGVLQKPGKECCRNLARNIYITWLRVLQEPGHGLFEEPCQEPGQGWCRSIDRSVAGPWPEVLLLSQILLKQTGEMYSHKLQ